MSDHYRRIDREILTSGEVHQDEMEFPVPGGKTRSFIFTRAPFYWADGSIRGIVGTMTEITPSGGPGRPSGRVMRSPGIWPKKTGGIRHRIRSASHGPATHHLFRCGGP
jgi:hypothetical protein